MRATRPQPARPGAVLSLESGLAAGKPLGRRHEIARRNYAQRIDTTPVGTGDAELKAGDVGRLTAPGQSSELFHQQTRDGVESLLLGELRAEVFVEFIDAGDAANGVLPISILADVQVFLDVELVIDLTDDLFHHIFNS